MRFHQKLSTMLSSLLFPFAAILISLIIGGIFIYSIGINPFSAYGMMFQGIASSRYQISVVFIKTTPLLITALGLAFAFRSGIFNIGAEGQIYIGALFGTIVGTLDMGFPRAVHILLCIAAAFIGGGFWASIPGYLKAKFNVNEIITTILMNYIASNLIAYLVRSPLRADQTSIASPQQTAEVVNSASLPIILEGTRLHFGFIIALILIGVVWFLMYSSSFGYKCRMIGLNPTASAYAGLNVVSLMVIAMIISGGLAGVAGAVEVMGVQRRLRASFMGSIGFKAIAVALLGKNNPIGILLTSVLFGALEVGSNTMESLAGVPAPLVEIIQATVILLVALSSVINENNFLGKTLHKFPKTEKGK